MKVAATIIAGIVLSNAAVAMDDAAQVDQENVYETIRMELNYTPDAKQVGDKLQEQLEQIGFAGDELSAKQSFKSSFEHLTDDAARYVVMAR